MDHVILQLLALVLGFAGGLAALAEYDVPELHLTFLGSNPFQAKHAAIRRFAIPLFLSFAALGALLQVIVIIWEPSSRGRLYEHTTYVCAALLMIAIAYALVRIGQRLTHALAINKWLPAVYGAQKNLVDRAWFASQNDWLFPEQAAELHLIDPNALPTAKDQNRRMISDQMELAAKLLDQSSRGSLPARIARLRAYLNGAAQAHAG